MKAIAIARSPRWRSWREAHAGERRYTLATTTSPPPRPVRSAFAGDAAKASK